MGIVKPNKHKPTVPLSKATIFTPKRNIIMPSTKTQLKKLFTFRIKDAAKTKPKSKKGVGTSRRSAAKKKK